MSSRGGGTVETLTAFIERGIEEQLGFSSDDMTAFLASQRGSVGAAASVREYLSGLLPETPSARAFVDALCARLAAAPPPSAIGASASSSSASSSSASASAVVALAAEFSPAARAPAPSRAPAPAAAALVDDIPDSLPPPALCPCAASRHALFCNCTSCGLVVCELSAARRCSFCSAPLSGARGRSDDALLAARQRGAAVGAAAEAALLRELTGGGGAASRRTAPPPAPPQLPLSAEAAVATAAAAVAPPPSAGMARALQHRDTLLDYQRNSAQRTRVVDDQDWHAAADSAWLSGEERAAAAAAAAARTRALTTRRVGKVTLDFSGRAVLVVDESAAEELAVAARLAVLAVGGTLEESEGEGHAAAAAAAAAADIAVDAGAAAPAAPNEPLLAGGSGEYINATLHGRAASIAAGLRDVAASR